MLRTTRLSLVLLGVLAATSPLANAAEPVEGLQFEHGDWALACDNTRTCRAAGYQADPFGEEGGLPVSVLLTRKAGPGTPVTGQLSALPEEESETLPQAATLRIGEQSLGRLAFESDDGAATLTTKQVAALLKALRCNSRIRVEEVSSRRRWELSGRGASAVLLKMDDFQGRVGTPGALVRRGGATRPESAALPAVPAPLIHVPPLPATREGDRALAGDASLLQALRQLPLAQDDECDLEGKRGTPPELEVRRLSRDKLLVSTRCWMAAYNEGIGYWVINDSPPWQPRLVTTSGSDDDKGRIFLGQKGRGIGDCWWTGEWAWDGQRYVHVAEAGSGLCRGFAGGAWQMPVKVSEVKD